MKFYSTEALGALNSDNVTVSGAVRFDTEDGVACFWGGFGPLVIDGETYTGVGDAGVISASAGTLGGAEQGAEIVLSGVDPEIVPGLNLRSLRRAPVVIWRLFFNGQGTVGLHYAVFLRGRVDKVVKSNTPGGTAEIKIYIEGAARGQGRRSERMRTDADQRLIDPDDSFFSRVSFAGEKVVYFGGKPPQRAGLALTGTGAASRLPDPNERWEVQ